MRDRESYTRKSTTDLLACDRIFGHKASGCTCPKCGTGTMQFYGKVVRCDNPDCLLPVFRYLAEHGQDTHRRGNDRSADGRKDGDARRVQEQAGQALQRCGDF